MKSEAAKPSPFDRFEALAKRLLQVSKKEINEEEGKRKAEQDKKPS